MKTLKIAVVGCGALGSYYGAQCLRAGHDVHFLLRSDYDTVLRQGVRVCSAEGDFHVHPRCARLPGEIGASDLVMIGLKTTANHEFSHLLPPLVGSHSAVLTLQNGLGNEEALARIFPAEQILGGLCFVCLNRLEPGLVHHIAHGRIVLGEFGRAPNARTHAMAEMLTGARVPCEVTSNLEFSHWRKLVWNIPFNGLGVASAAGLDAILTGGASIGSLQPCLTTDLLLADPKWHAIVRQLMREVIETANALGFDLTPSTEDDNIRDTLGMGPYKASTLIDYERGQPLELESLFLEPLRRARLANVPTPRLAALCAVLAKLAPRPQV